MSLSELGVKRDGPLEVSNGGRSITRFQQPLAQEIISFGRIRMQAHRLGCQRNKLVNAVQFLKPASQGIAREHMRAVKLEYLAQLLDFAVHPVLASIGQGQVELHFDKAGA